MGTAKTVAEAPLIIDALSKRKLYPVIDVGRLRRHLRDIGVTVSKQQMAKFWTIAQENGVGKYVHGVYPEVSRFKFKTPHVPEDALERLRSVFAVGKAPSPAAQIEGKNGAMKHLFMFRWGGERLSLRTDTPTKADVEDLMQGLSLLLKLL